MLYVYFIYIYITEKHTHTLRRFFKWKDILMSNEKTLESIKISLEELILEVNSEDTVTIKGGIFWYNKKF